MRNWIACFISLISFAGTGLLWAENPRIAYTAEVKGIVCQACAADVKVAFAKLPGVHEVEFKKTENSDLCLVQFSSSSDKLTVEDCERALGDKMKEFSVVKLTAKK